MVFGVSLITISIVALSYGVVKKNRAIMIASIISLLIITAIYLTYLYLYSKTPY